jgi:hypothetical protein
MPCLTFCIAVHGSGAAVDTPLADLELSEPVSAKVTSSAMIQQVSHQSRLSLTIEHLRVAIQAKEHKIVAFLMVYTTVCGSRNDSNLGPFAARDAIALVNRLWREIHGESVTNPSAVSSSELLSLIERFQVVSLPLRCRRWPSTCVQCSCLCSAMHMKVRGLGPRMEKARLFFPNRSFLAFALLTTMAILWISASSWILFTNGAFRLIALSCFLYLWFLTPYPCPPAIPLPW